MDIYERLDELVELIQSARSVPLSDSCFVSRPTALDLVSSARESLPVSLRDAATILADRDDVLEDARREAEARIAAAQDNVDVMLSRAENEVATLNAQTQSDAERELAMAREESERIIAHAQDEAARLVAAETVSQEAQVQAAAVRAEADADSGRVRAEADIYVDRRLAALEDTLRSALDQISRGRRRANAAVGNPAGEEIYDFAQDPGVADDLTGRGRGRGRR